MKAILLLISLLPFACSVQAQFTSVTPALPKWNDQLTINYHYQDEHALLSGDADVYIRYKQFFQDGHYERRNYALQKKSGRFETMVKVDSGAASIEIDFYTLTADDPKAAQKLIVVDQKGSPVAGAYRSSFWSDSLQVYFDKEINAYPGNYSVYAEYFNITSLLRDATESHKTIMTQLAALEKVQNKNDEALLAALCIGYAKTDRLNEARPVLDRLLDLSPGSYYAERAFTLYAYERYKIKPDNFIDSALLKKLRTIFMQHPSAPICHNTHTIHFLRKDPSIPIEAFEAVLLPLMRKEQLEYYELLLLAEIYEERGVKTAAAKDIVLVNMMKFTSGMINHQYRLGKSHYNTHVASGLLLLAKLNNKLGNYHDAVINSNAGIQVVTGTSWQDVFMNDFKKQRALAHLKAGNINMSMEDYAMLLADKNSSVLAIMRDAHAQSGLKGITFEAFTAQWNKNKPAPKTAADKAPSFKGIAMNGDTVALDQLKGKVIVLNFWGTGCGPCIAEMPELNKVVEKYKAQQDIVFLGVTGDSPKRLQAFFKKRKFDYTIVNGVDFNGYDIESLPVHVVIDKEGNIVLRRLGASDDIGQKLSGAIEKSLNR